MRHRAPEKQTKQDEEKEPIIQFSEKKANTFKDFFSSFAEKKTSYQTINQSQNENIVDFLIFRLYRSDITRMYQAIGLSGLILISPLFSAAPSAGHAAAAVAAAAPVGASSEWSVTGVGRASSARGFVVRPFAAAVSEFVGRRVILRPRRSNWREKTVPVVVGAQSVSAAGA